jgi:hypothetical protein
LPSVKREPRDIQSWKKSVSRLHNWTQGQSDDLPLVALLVRNTFPSGSSADRLRRHHVWRDMFRANDTAITALAAETARCWLTYSFDPNETKEFGKILFTSSAGSTTDHEAYNLLLDHFTDWARNDKITERFSRYNRENWDGYGADPITPETISAARKFVKMLPKNLGEPEMAPGSDGIIALEWLFNEPHPLRKLFIDIGPGSVWSAYFRRADGAKRSIPQQPIANHTKQELEALFAELSE